MFFAIIKCYGGKLITYVILITQLEAVRAKVETN